MPTTIRTLNKRGETLGIRTIPDRSLNPKRPLWKLFGSQYHPCVRAVSELERSYQKYVYRQEQLALNAVRTGVNLVDPERTKHILEGSPILRVSRKKFDDQGFPATSVRGWSGGHANPNAAQYGKTQIPDCWTGERFMYEVSDILVSDNSRWYLQETDDSLLKGKPVEEEQPDRYVCVEKRYGVPIRVVAERVDDEMKCVTAFPDYSSWEMDENLRVFTNVGENSADREKS